MLPTVIITAGLVTAVKLCMTAAKHVWAKLSLASTDVDAEDSTAGFRSGRRSTASATANEVGDVDATGVGMASTALATVLLILRAVTSEKRV